MRIRGVAGVAVGVALLATGCGSAHGNSTNQSAASPSASPDNGIAKRSPQDIISAARDVLQQATSAHIQAISKERNNGFDLDFHATRTDSQGKMTQIEKSVPVPMEVTLAAGKVYLKSPELWRERGGPTLAQLVGDRWVLVPAKEKLAMEFASIATLGGVSRGMRDDSNPPYTTGSRAVVNGEPVIAVTDAKHGTFYVATTGTPRMIEAVSPDKLVTFSFTEWNAPLTVTAPAGALDLSRLEKRA